MGKYDDTIVVIQNMARVKLAMNSHKGAIEDMDDSKIMALLRGEVNELDEAEGMLDTIEEAADVYNFLMALVHKKIEAYRERK
jgi:hypothetical protein